MYNNWLDDAVFLAHSAKGTTWDDHKYIAIRNGRYIYPSDIARSNRSTNSASQFTSQNRQNVSYKGNGQPLFKPKRKPAVPKNSGVERVKSAIRSNQLADEIAYRSQRYNQKKQSPLDGLFSAASNIARDAGNFIVDRIDSRVPGFKYLRDHSSELGNGDWVNQPAPKNVFERINRYVDRNAHRRNMARQGYEEFLRDNERDDQRKRELSEEQARRRGEFDRNAEIARNATEDLVRLHLKYQNDPYSAIADVAENLQRAYQTNNPSAIALAEEEYDYVNSLTRGN